MIDLHNCTTVFNACTFYAAMQKGYAMFRYAARDPLSASWLAASKCSDPLCYVLR